MTIPQQRSHQAGMSAMLPPAFNTPKIINGDKKPAKEKDSLPV